MASRTPRAVALQTAPHPRRVTNTVLCGTENHALSENGSTPKRDLTMLFRRSCSHELVSPRWSRDGGEIRCSRRLGGISFFVLPRSEDKLQESECATTEPEIVPKRRSGKCRRALERTNHRKWVSMFWSVVLALGGNRSGSIFAIITSYSARWPCLDDFVLRLGLGILGGLLCRCRSEYSGSTKVYPPRLRARFTSGVRPMTSVGC
jgi:hypothetical protein